MTDLTSLARTLAERLTLDVAELPDRTSPDDWPEAMLITDSELRQMAEAVIREAIDKTLEEAALFADGKHDGVAAAIRSLKQSNSVAEDEGPCADCGRPKSDSAMHLDSPGKGWGAALHWFKQSNSGRAEPEAGGRR